MVLFNGFQTFYSAQTVFSNHTYTLVSLQIGLTHLQFDAPGLVHELEIGESEVRESECVKTNLKRVQRCNLRNVYQILMRLVSLES